MEVPTFEVCPDNQALFGKPGQSTTVAVWQHPEATDNSGNKPTVTCSHMSGSHFAIGDTLVKCEASDNWGNIEICRFNIFVVYVIGT